MAWAVWWRVELGGGAWHTKELGRSFNSFIFNELECGAKYQVGLFFVKEYFCTSTY